MRTLAMLLAVLCAAFVALAVFVFRALAARGVDLAGALLDAMGAPRPARRVHVVVGASTQTSARPSAPSSPAPPVNRRRVRAFDGPAPGRKRHDAVAWERTANDTAGLTA